MDKKSPQIPVVFISSTVEDLRPYRAAAKEAVISARCLPRMMEYFAAEGKNPPLAECMRHIDDCDVLVVIVANRYGWIPKEQKKGEAKSITWLECLHAGSQEKEVIAFILDPNKKDWPPEYNEENIIAKAIQEGTATPELFASVQQAVKDLKDFKKWLNDRGVRADFVNTHDLHGKVYKSLVEWRERQTDRFQSLPKPSDPQLYLEWLREESGYIDIRGLQVGAGKANRFGIEELYIPLTTVSMLSEAKRALQREERLESRRVELHEVLQSPRAAIIGEPGAGKTTFLKRIAFALCQTLQGIEPEAAEKRLGLKTAYFPIYIRLFELIQHITRCEKRNKSDCPTLATDPQWLVHFLSEKSSSQEWKLGQDFWQEKLSSDQVILLLDGLDEAPDRGERERISELISQAVRTYRDARFVITSRPLAYVGKAVLQEFPQATIDSLEPEAINFYLQRWTKAAYFDAPLKADEHYLELRQALHERPEIRKLARNPVMLTALAVVHWNEKRLPEQRADLYDSIITWLLRSREQRPGRLSSEQCRERLQQLALTMQLDEKGRQVQIGRRKAAEAIQHYFKEKSKEKQLAAADQFLAEEEVDSGVIVGRGNELVFWHLTFQEYLCAKALAGKTDENQGKILATTEILHSPEWREVLLLYAGVLYRQGRDRADAFFRKILDKAEQHKRLADEARCVGLIGAMLRDLQPFVYQIPDERYEKLLGRTMAIFDKEKAKGIALESRIEAAEALGQAGDPRLKEDNMVLIPAGKVRGVKITAFRIGRFPVTVEEYNRFIEDDGYEKAKYWRAGGYGKFSAPEKWEEQKEFPNRPVVWVSWYEAAAYCTWAGGRLPTEAEWEWAAGRGERKYTWGNSEPTNEKANYWETGLRRTTPVGMFPAGATPDGLLDMAGNVWEWCEDWSDEKEQKYRVLRGGSWDVVGYRLQCSYRGGSVPVNRDFYFGFRLVHFPSH